MQMPNVKHPSFDFKVVDFLRCDSNFRITIKLKQLYCRCVSIMHEQCILRNTCQSCIKVRFVFSFWLQHCYCFWIYCFK